MGPLDGVKVLDLSQIVSGPMAGAWLADQGAEVIKLETPAGDPVRSFGARKGRTSALYVAVNRGKRGETIDLKDPGAATRFEELVAWADVLIENFRPGTMERLGYPYERCAALNPRLVWCAITGFGPDGPYANLRAYDPVVQAASGLCAIQADPDGTPRLVGTLVCDKVTALTAAQAITAALFARERTGRGQKLEVAMLDAAVAFNWVEGMYNQAFVEPADPAPDYAALGRLWPVKDGHVACSALQDIEFRALRALLAEDNPVNQQIARRQLQRLGLEVDVVDDGRRAVEAFASGTYDLVFMDCQMPGVDGLEATRRLRQSGVATPIVALTASVLDETRRACAEAGMNDYLAKPVELHQWTGTLARWLAASPAPVSAPRPAADR